MEERSPTANIFIILLLLFICFNLFILDMKVFSPESNIKISDISTSIPLTLTPVISDSITFSQTNSACPSSCVSLIKEATSGAPIGGIQPTQTITAVLPVSNQIHEFYIPLGSGSTQKNTWDELSGTETVIDPANYGQIKEAYFSASIRNPNQNGQTDVQLYNVTDKHPVWYSNVSMNGPVSQTINSGKIVLDNGNKLYRVQMKSSLSAQVFLDNAKIRIITE